MTMSAALDSGLAFAVVVVFFGFIYPGWTENFRWWGTEVYKQVRTKCIRSERCDVSFLTHHDIGMRLASLFI